MKNYVLVFAALCLTACAVPLTSQEMMPQYDFYDQVRAKTFRDKIFVKNVDVAKGVGGASPVTPEEYRAALVSSFRQADLYSRQQDAKYTLDAYMSDMKQPVFGFNMTAEATAEYTLRKHVNDSVVYQETLSLPCTKTFGDAFDGAIRLRMASGCSVGENITHLIKVLSSK